MPQLDVSTFLPQLFWLAVWFVILYLLMAKLGLPRVKATLDGRRQRLEGDLARAVALKAEAEAALAAYQKTLAEARATAQETLRQAARQRQLAETLAAQIEAAEQRIAAGKEAALGEIRGIATEVGGAVVEKLTGRVPDSARLAGAVGRALNGRAA
jgi:F-type H+-transporting ATPase subunit b